MEQSFWRSRFYSTGSFVESNIHTAGFYPEPDESIIIFLSYCMWSTEKTVVGIWDECTINIVSCSGFEICWLCTEMLFLFFFVWVGCEVAVLKIALPYPSVRFRNKQVLVVTQPHKLVQTYFLFILLRLVLWFYNYLLTVEVIKHL